MSSESPCPLGGPVEGVDVMCFRGHHFLIIYYIVIHSDLDPYCSIRNTCFHLLNAFVLNLAHFLLCYFGGIIFGQEAISLHRDIIIIGRCVISVTSL